MGQEGAELPKEHGRSGRPLMLEPNEECISSSENERGGRRGDIISLLSENFRCNTPLQALEDQCYSSNNRKNMGEEAAVTNNVGAE